MTPITTLDARALVPGLAPTRVSVVTLDHNACDIICDTLALGGEHTLLGVSARLSQGRGAIEAIALATPRIVYHINIPKHAFACKPKNHKSARTALARVLEHPKCLLAGAGVARLALLVQKQTGAHVSGVELLALPASTHGRPPTVADLAETYLTRGTKKGRIHALWLRKSNEDLCLKAWLLASIADKCAHLLQKHKKLDTRTLNTHQLACLAELVLNIELLDAEKPTSADGEFSKIALTPNGQLALTNSRYKSRVRPSAQTVIEINGGAIKARANYAKGKSTGLVAVKGKFPKDLNVAKVRVIGREQATCAEHERDDFLLRLLQGLAILHTSPFVRTLWFHTGGSVKTQGASNGGAPDLDPPSFGRLNPSQRRVALAMISNDEPLVIAHGPPGTGKTSTIAAALEHWDMIRAPAWVIAHSNVGVQNIAEGLFKRGLDFKIIVSQEFHCEWHEHLYEEIERHLIRTDDFGKGFDAKNAIADTTVILCTLSMLSNPALGSYGVFAHVPVVRLIVDEASQIDTFEFMHLFDKFAKPMSKRVASSSLAKVCMFGDPNQLPPFGADTAPKIKTIFDFKQFKSRAYFLDTQYRMPVPIGDFISKEVYDSKLQSVHEIKSNSCVRFIDVRKGQEQRGGRSWKNTEEANTIVNLVKKYYQHLNWCIITPYDAQRAAITAALKAANVKRFDHVYNVDSFQGHEAPYIIVSTVRTSSAGFLKSLNRMNVMLTRCQEGLVIITQRAFLHNPRGGKSTLLGKLAEHWESRVGASVAWADAMEVADERASLPGAPGRNAPLGSDEADVDGLAGRMNTVALG